MDLSIRETQKRVAGFAAACRRLGIRATHQRTEIYRELARTGEHPDARTIYRRVRRRIPAISFDTVYRTLRLLERKEIIARVGHQGDSARFDANMDRHHHFVCTVCGSVKDFRSAALDGLPIPKAVEAFGRIKSAQAQVRGVCSACTVRKSKLTSEA